MRRGVPAEQSKLKNALDWLTSPQIKPLKPAGRNMFFKLMETQDENTQTGPAYYQK